MKVRGASLNSLLKLLQFIVSFFFVHSRFMHFFHSDLSLMTFHRTLFGASYIVLISDQLLCPMISTTSR